MAEQTKFEYTSDGVDFVIYKTIKAGQTCWLLADKSTGERRLLNHLSRKAAERRADQIRAAMVKGQAHRALLSNGQWQDVCMAVEILRSAQTCESLGSAI